MNTTQLIQSYREQLDGLKKSYPNAIASRSYYDDLSAQCRQQLEKDIFNDEEQKLLGAMIVEIEKFIETSRPHGFPGGTAGNC